MSGATPPSIAAASVVRLGASSPIGYGNRAIQAAMAGKLRNFQDAQMLGSDGKPVRISRMPDLPEQVRRPERVAALVRAATEDLFENLTLELPANLPIFFGVGHDALDAELAAIGRAIHEGSDGALTPDAASFAGYRAGRIAFLSALARAIRAFTESTTEMALIVGVDTRCTWHAMDALYRERRLLSSTDDGSIPGEGAVVALVAAPHSRWAAEHGRFMLCGPAFAEDDFVSMRRSPQAAHGLGRAFNALRGHPIVGAERPGSVITFDTGELFFTRAFTTGYLRSAELMPEPMQLELIASNVGDTGAAAAGLAIVRADWMMHRQDGAACSRILVYGHADSGKCAAAMLIRQPSGEQ